MLHALDAALDYYRANFSPYQFDQARIMEFPGYDSFAQAFANTMPYSEAIGFNANTDDPDKIDFTTYVVAHEMAHQWWAHQIIGADMQGGTMLSETLAQYSALMVMKHLYGPDKIRRFLKYELDRYLRARGAEAVEELPLERVEDQRYIHYRKGSLVMYLLQERIGEAAVNRALAALLAQVRLQGRALPALARPGRRVPQGSEDARAAAADHRPVREDHALRPQGRRRRRPRKDATGWTTTLTIDADKYYANGKGVETKAPLNEPIEIGLFTARPGIGAFSSKDVIVMQRLPIHSGGRRSRSTSRRSRRSPGSTRTITMSTATATTMSRT